MPRSEPDRVRREAFAALRAGRLRQADALGGRLLALDANDDQALYLQCCVARVRGDFAAAAKWAKRGTAAHPVDPRFHVELGNAWAGRGDFDEAIRCFDAALALDPRHASAVAFRADTLLRRGAIDDALASLEAHAAAGGDEPSVAAVHARVLLAAGDHEAAVALARRAVEGRDVDPYVRCNLHASIARSCEKLGRFDEAFEAYAASHPRGGRPFDLDGFVLRIDRLIDAFSRTALASLPTAAVSSDRPVFIVGMPRCGSTLVEQIIHAHPKGRGAGELTAMNDVLNGIRRLLGTDRAYPECIVEFTREHVDTLSRRYLDAIERVGGDAERVVDKALDNYRRLGLIQLLVPGARVIHCRRDPVDTCFSCFASNLSTVAYPYVSDLGTLGLVYRQYERLMRHWAGALDVPVLEVVYEDIVRDPDPAMRRVIEFCGLDWDDRCRRFHEAERLVLTASHEQVRRPVYRGSVGRAANFDRHLAPLREALAT